MSSHEPVSLVKCDTYEYSDVRKALDESLSLIHGLEFVKPGMKVGIKANLVTGMAPERAVTTHPILIRVLCDMLTEKGATVVIGDSPGGLFTSAFLKGVYKSCGLFELENDKVKLNDDFSVRDAEFPEAVSIRNFTYTGWLDKCDAIVNISKLKTHAMMAMTCSVKNLFGTIPGTGKPECHMRFPSTPAFANLMIDLNEYFTPVLNIVDGIDAMEGNGPTAGSVRHMGILLASRSPYNLDLACAGLIGLDRSSVPTLEQAWQRGLGKSRPDELVIIGKDAYDHACVKDFQLVSKPMSITFASKGPAGALFGKAAEWIFSSRPQLYADDCIRCGKCAQVCPAKAIHMEGVPVIDRTKCIHCFCCQEFCPRGAMRVHLNPVGKLIRYFNVSGSAGTSAGR